jgi:FKBP-type peptidyl-prolyl cis-trans isomerase FkpA
MKKLLLLLLPAVLLWSGCTDQSETDEAIILDYLEANNLTAQRTEEGIYYIIEVEGTGAHPTISNTVKAHYEGYLTDGYIFDSSIQRGTPSDFPLSGVITGWQIGIPLFKEGGKGKLLIPSAHAYGANPPSFSGIPRNAVLIFDVELIEIL